MASMASEASSSSSCSSASNSFKYQVFLSFRGEDTRYNITDTLYNTLCEKGINTFMDAKLPKGEKISAELVKAIKESKVSIIIFSENYASSRWCLDELVEILQCKASNLQQQVRVIFYKVDPSHVRYQIGKFGDAFKKLDQGSRYKDSMPKWKKALSDAADLSGWPFSDCESEYQFIRKIVKELSQHVWVPSYVLEVAKYPIGIDSCKQEVEKLLAMEKNNVRMLGIWGPGGIGKSEIAKSVFNSIGHNFEGRCFLSDVRLNSIPHGGLAKLQETLLLEIFKDVDMEVHNVDIGVSLIKMRMQHKKVLLVLDDVSDVEQIEKLAPSSDCFGPGSRIIITTRDTRCLTSHDVDIIYNVKMLDDAQASKLFSWHAFKCDGPPNDYLELAQRAICYAGGLPLALVVLGSHLFRRNKDEWEATLDSFEGDHRMKIEKVLRLSYDTLGEDLKGYFLDIACFFKGKSVSYVKPILEACYNLKSVIGLTQLQEKALIRIEGDEQEHGVIWMHDLLVEMGKDIGKSSRLWNLDDVDHILRDNTGTKKIEGILFSIPGEIDTKISLNDKSFSKMKNLKFMSMGDMYYECSSVDIDFLSNELRWLDWPGCPLRSFPTNFSPRKLVRLSITNSCITRLWEGRKILPFLKSINLGDCPNLAELPDFTGTPNLEMLMVMECESLLEMHHSVGALQKLVILHVIGCSNLTAFPKVNGKMSFLRELRLSFNGIFNLDSSIGKLRGLKELNLSYCEKLTTLPSSIYELRKLEKLSVIGCLKFVTFPVMFEKMDFLRELNILSCGIEELEPSIANLNGLQKLSLRGCKSFTTLPCSIYELQNLQRLTLRGCSRLVTFPTKTYSGGGSLSLPKLEVLDIGRCNLSNCDFLQLLDCLETLSYLDLSYSSFVSLPVCISKFLKLEVLNLQGCQRLQQVPELPANLVKVDARDCDELKRFWNLPEVLQGQERQLIKWISLSPCGKLLRLGYNTEIMEGLLLGNQANFPYCVVFPEAITDEDTKWLDCWKATTHEQTNLCSTDGRSWRWDDRELAVCVVSKEVLKVMLCS